MARAFAAYLVNEEKKKHMWIAALNDTERKKWVVVMAWGLIGTVYKETVYDKDFSGQKNAEAYAKAIASTKQRDEDFQWHWDSSSPNDADDFDNGDVPEWWSDSVCKNIDHSSTLGSIDAAKNKGSSHWKPSKTAAVTTPAAVFPRAPSTKQELPKIEKLKEKMAAKLKIEAGKAKIAVKSSVTEDDEPEKEEVKRVIQPRFGFAPRSK